MDIGESIGRQNTKESKSESNDRLDIWSTQLRIRGDIEQLVRQRKAETGQSLNEILCEWVEAGATDLPDGAMPPTLEHAAYVFLEALDDDHRRILLDNVDEHKRTLAEYMVSAIKLAHDRGETAYLMPDAAMPADVIFDKLTTPTSQQSELVCQRPECGRLIARPYVRPDQRFCHPPDEGESCGRLYEQGRINAQRQEQVTARQSSDLAINLAKIVPRSRRT